MSDAVIVQRVMTSPVGLLLLTAARDAQGEERLSGIWFEQNRHPPRPDPTRMVSDAPSAVLDATVAQLEEYFAGERRDFDLPLAPRGTDFQLRVWELLRTIPYAGTTSYGEIARRLGDPSSTRAVGAANGRNPIPIVVPCHRVIGANGDLTGFGGGIERKRWLLEHEARVAGRGQGELGL